MSESITMSDVRSMAVAALNEAVAKAREQRAKNRPERPIRRMQQSVVVSTIGDDIRSAIEAAIGGRITCGACLTFLRKLNHSATHDHNKLVDELYRIGLPIPIKIRERHKGPTKLRRWISDVIVSIVPSFARAIEYPIPFVTSIAVGVRIAKRETPRWYATVNSIEDAGFPPPILFAEPDSGYDAIATADHVWPSKLGPIASFKAMCGELLKQSAEWLLLCEDDIAVSDHTTDLVRTWNLTNEVVSLYTCGPRQLLSKGLAEAKQMLVGSLALLMRRSTLQMLMNSKAWQQWSRHDCVDRMVYRACQECGIPLLTHNPSLVQHTGDTAAIYADRKLTAIRTAKDWMKEGIYAPPLVTLITPTGDRHEAFTKCEQWMRQQSYTGATQWLVIDDGKIPTKCNMDQEYIREQPLTYHSLCRNIRRAIPHIRGEYVLIIEDDDYYHPHYISTMVGRLHHADLVGEVGAKYYYLRHRSWRHNVHSENHASLCRTGMRSAVIQKLKSCAHGSQPSIDLRLWRGWQGSRLTWRDTEGTQSLCVGIKGVEGRQSKGWRPSRNAQPDANGEVLRRWVGDDARHYER